MTTPVNFPPLPAGIAKAGVETGRPDRHHPAAGPNGCLNLVWWCIILGGLFFCLCGYLGITDTNSGPSDIFISKMVIGLIGVPMILAGWALIRWTKGTASMEVWTTPGGIGWRSAYTLGFMRWDDLERFYRQTIKRYTNGQLTGVYVHLQLTASDGTTAKFREFVGDIYDLEDRIDREVTQRRLPATLARVQNGETVTFDKVSISRAGVAKGAELLPWSEIEAVRVENGQFAVQRHGKFLNWANINVYDIPNFTVFIEVVSQLAGSKLS